MEPKTKRGRFSLFTITIFWCSALVAAAFAWTFIGQPHASLSDMRFVAINPISFYVLLFTAFISTGLRLRMVLVLAASLWATNLALLALSLEVGIGPDFAGHWPIYVEFGYRSGEVLILTVIFIRPIPYFQTAVELRKEYRGLGIVEKIKYINARTPWRQR